ncbi:MAG: hypothetical protein V1846_04975 [Candidatus Komeilibacteria bacterium]
MTPERWEQVKQLIRGQYAVTDEYEEQLDPGVAHCLEFTSPAGQLKVCFVQQPKVLTKKTNYTHRSGGETQVSYVFDPNETTSHLEVFLLNEASGIWQEMSAEALPLA